MTEEIIPREDRMGKILTFISGCLTGVLGVFAVAVMSEMSPSPASSPTSCDNEDDEQEVLLSLQDEEGL